MSLLTLPNELQLDIVQSLDRLRDTYHLALTCRRFTTLLLPILHAAAKSDTGGFTALGWACHRGHEGLVRFLLREGLPVGHHDRDHRPAIYGAIEGRKPRVIVPILLEHGADITIPDPHRKITTLHAAVSAGDETVLKLLLDRGALAADVRVADGTTPLYRCCAARAPNPDIAALLITHGADPRAAVTVGTHRNAATLLHVAVANRAGSSAGVVRALLAHGADIDAGDTGGQTPLHYAASQRGANGGAKVAILLERGADVTAVDGRGRTPLHLAAADGACPGVCEALLRRGADAAARDTAGCTPLDAAAVGAGAMVPLEDAEQLEPRYEATIRVLLERGGGGGAGVDGQVLLWAVKNGHRDLVRMALDRGADVNVCGADGRAALHWAALLGMADVVGVLLERGADAGVVGDGKTALALALAAAGGEDGVVELLVGAGGLGSGRAGRGPPAAHGSRRGAGMG